MKSDLSANDLLQSFSIGLDDPIPPRSIRQVLEIDDSVELKRIRDPLSKIEKLKAEGLLVEICPGTDEHPIIDKKFVATDWHPIKGFDGEYECLVGGWPEVYRRFRHSIWRIETRNKNGDLQNGTCFVAAKPWILTTAKHVLFDNPEFRVFDPRGVAVFPQEVFVPKEDNIDIAILRVEQKIGYGTTQPLRFSRAAIGEEVISLGFPNTPLLDNPLVAEKGNVTSSGHAYLSRSDSVIVSMKLTGGNSGAPIINRLGRVLGLVSTSPISANDSESPTGYGFASCVPTNSILELAKGMTLRTADVRSMDVCHSSGHYFKISKP